MFQIPKFTLGILRHFKPMLTLFVLFCTILADGQSKDTIVIKDLTLTFFKEENGEYEIITRLNSESKAMFMLNSEHNLIRICSDNDLFLWKSDQLVEKINGCQKLELISDSTTIYSLISNENFSNLVCEKLGFYTSENIKETSPLLKNNYSNSRDFLLISSLVILLTVVIRVSYSKSISWKFRNIANSKNIVGTSFFSLENILKVVSIAMIISFLFTFFSYSIEVVSLSQKIFKWFSISIIVFVVFTLKNSWSSIVSYLLGLNQFGRYVSNDFISFLSVILLPLWLIFTIQSLRNFYTLNIDQIYFEYTLAVIIIGFNLLMLYKMVGNRKSEKLQVFAYLCATEMIPAIFLVAWFFKYL